MVSIRLTGTSLCMTHGHTVSQPLEGPNKKDGIGEDMMR